MIIFLNNLTGKQLLEFLESLKLKESDKVARLMSTDEKKEIINRISDPNDKNEISNIYSIWLWVLAQISL